MLVEDNEQQQNNDARTDDVAASRTGLEESEQEQRSEQDQKPKSDSEPEQPLANDCTNLLPPLSHFEYYSPTFAFNQKVHGGCCDHVPVAWI